MSSKNNYNRLIQEKSPYLLQHAHNPVDWYPWGQEAFTASTEEDKPIFLSIGYATCHWCHVMKKESFQSPGIAKLMNDTFINIKVDREEMPDIDNLYMEFAQAMMTTGVGWPLNILITPQLKPFFAVTYLPPFKQEGNMGLNKLILEVKDLWHSELRSELLKQSELIVELFQDSLVEKGDELPTFNHIVNGVNMVLDQADPVYGGLQDSPKFPLGFQANFLLSYAKIHSDSHSLFFVELTLKRMGMGGLYDHIGGGFSRYCIDDRWHVPHFEKMLYDNAIQISAYLDLWKIQKKTECLNIITQTLDYVLRAMQSPEGGFFSAEDADSDGKEGAFYTWSKEEIDTLLGKNDSAIFCEYYNVQPQGSFEKKNILYQEITLKEFADIKSIHEGELKQVLDRSQKQLFNERKKRNPPFKDDKILTSWNGLMIDTLMRAGSALARQDYSEAGLKAIEFILSNLWTGKQLFRRWRDNEARFSATLDDYVFLIRALLTLFEEGYGTRYLSVAIQMVDILEKTFKVKDGAFYFTKPDDAVLMHRCEFYDGAVPSGNGVHSENLLRLFQITRDQKYMKQAEDVLKAAKPFIEAYPLGTSYYLITLQRYFDKKAPTILIALDDKQHLKEELNAELAKSICSHLSVIWKTEGDKTLEQLAPYTKGLKPIDGQTAIYICKQNHCKVPLVNKKDIFNALAKL